MKFLFLVNGAKWPLGLSQPYEASSVEEAQKEIERRYPNGGGTVWQEISPLPDVRFEIVGGCVGFSTDKKP